MLDHPKVRDLTVCPICGGFKDKGLIVDWGCYRRHNIKYGNPRCEQIIDQYEADLVRAQATVQPC